VQLVGNKHNSNLVYMFIHNNVMVTTDFTSMSQWIVLVIFLLNILTINKKACEVSIFLGCGTVSGRDVPIVSRWHGGPFLQGSECLKWTNQYTKI
jgi:hypothetical protein